uniref:Protein naked cuticle homolog n=2 Tax=Ciona savignyi TaxID=51511 RepID=H2YB81_CIOSA
MGLKHSKPRLRRRMSSRSSKNRLNPEGSPSPAAVTAVANSANSKATCNHACPCRNKTELNGEENRPLTSGSGKHTSSLNPLPDADKSFLPYDGSLKVTLPPDPDPRKGERTSDEARVTSNEPTDNDFTVTLFESGNLSQNEEILRLMTSIRDVVDTSVNKCHGQKVRVRLSVTPEPRVKNRLHDDITQSLRHPPRSKSEEVKGTSFRRSSSDTARQEEFCEHDHQSINDRSNHYRQIPGGNEDLAKLGSEETCTPINRRSRKSRTSKPHEAGACCSRQRRHGRTCHNDRSQSGKCQSAFDRNFQETMYLRLRELQKNSERQAKLARRAEGHDDASDSDVKADDASDNVCKRRSKQNISYQPVNYTNNESDSEYSGDDDGHVLPSTSAIEHPVSRMFEPLSRQAVEAISRPRDRSSEKRVEGHVEHSLALNFLKSPKCDDRGMVYRHVHAHDHQNQSEKSEISDENDAEKPWNRSNE